MTKCPACHSAKVSLFHKINSLPAILFPVNCSQAPKVPACRLLIHHCPECGHLFQTKWSEIFIKSIYNKWYRFYPFDDLESMNVTYRRPYEKFVLSVLKKTTKAKTFSVLEIGCSKEHQLRMFLDRCASVTAINPKVPKGNKASFIKGFYGTKIINRKFDVISSRFNLEHITNLPVFFRNLHNNIKDGGSVFVQVPNVSHFLSSGMLNIFAHEHIHYFNHKSFARMVDTYGFAVKQMDNTRGASIIAELVESPSISLYNAKANAMKTTEQIKAIIRLATGKVMFYGAGLSLTSLLYERRLLQPQLSKKIVVVDDNPAVRGRVMPRSAISVSSLSQETLRNSSHVIITASEHYHKAILKKLRSVCPNVKVIAVGSNGLLRL